MRSALGTLLALRFDDRTTIRTLALWRVRGVNVDAFTDEQVHPGVLGHLIETHGVCA